MRVRASSDLFLYGQLKEYARENRKHPTEAEAVLWQYLKGRNLQHSFFRQYIIDCYIVDFVCRESKLVIEVDGGYHSEPRQVADDEVRTERLQSLGYGVIRFSNDEILCHLDEVIKMIQIEIL